MFPDKAHVTKVFPGARLAVIPRFETDWPTFTTSTFPRSIAIDGFVSDLTTVDLTTRHFNFNHHRGCKRWITLCTSAQVKASLKAGLLKLLLVDDAADFTVYANDPDPDSALAAELLLYATTGLSDGGPLLNRLSH